MPQFEKRHSREGAVFSRCPIPFSVEKSGLMDTDIHRIHLIREAYSARIGEFEIKISHTLFRSKVSKGKDSHFYGNDTA